MDTAELMQQERKPQTLADALQKMKPQVKMALPRGMDEDRFIRTVLTLIQKTPDLAKCSASTVLLGVMQSAELGLELGTIMGHAYLIPYKGQAQLQIGWRGFIELARRSGEVRGISAEVVYENDRFHITKGIDPTLFHEPLLKGDRGEAIGAYAVAFFKDGFKDFEWMDLDQIKHCQNSSRASREDAPWKTHWEEMARKTPIRRLCKRLPLSPEDSALIRAAVLDEYHEAGIIEDPPKGVIELSAGSPLQRAVENGSQVHPEPVELRGAEESAVPTDVDRPYIARPIVNFHVGHQLTFINGQTQPIEKDLRKLFPKREEAMKAWSIPATSTEDFLTICEQRGVSAIETDKDWNPLPIGQSADLFNEHQ